MARFPRMDSAVAFCFHDLLNGLLMPRLREELVNGFGAIIGTQFRQVGVYLKSLRPSYPRKPSRYILPVKRSKADLRVAILGT